MILGAAQSELHSGNDLRTTATQEAIASRSAAETDAAAMRADARDADELMKRAQAEFDAAIELEASVEESRRHQ